MSLTFAGMITDSSAEPVLSSSFENQEFICGRGRADSWMRDVVHTVWGRFRELVGGPAVPERIREAFVDLKFASESHVSASSPSAVLLSFNSRFFDLFQAPQMKQHQWEKRKPARLHLGIKTFPHFLKKKMTIKLFLTYIKPGDSGCD